MDTITITKEQLKRVFKYWNQEDRDGKCLSEADTAELSVEEIAQESADFCWDALKLITT